MMRRKSTRKLVVALRKTSAERSLSLAVREVRGEGNHVGIIIEDPNGGRGVCLVIDDRGEVSRAVRRRLKEVLADRAADGAISAPCREAVVAALAEAGIAGRERKEGLFELARREFRSERVKVALVR